MKNKETTKKELIDLINKLKIEIKNKETLLNSLLLMLDEDNKNY